MVTKDRFLLILLPLCLPIYFWGQTDLETVPYRKGDKWGIVKIGTKEIVCPPIYDEIGPFDRLVTWMRKGKRYRFIDRNGLAITKFRYRKVTEKRWEKAVEKHRRKYYWYYGWKKKKEKEILRGICGGSIVADACFNQYKENDKIGLFIPIKAFETLTFHDFPILDSLPANTWHGQYRKGKYVATLALFDSIECLPNFLIFAKKDGYWHLLKQNGNLLNNNKYQQYDSDPLSWQIDDIRTMVKKNDKWGFLNINGQEIISTKYNTVAHFRYDPVTKVVCWNNKPGYIDRLGNEYFED